jgi:hypothetical protein
MKTKSAFAGIAWGFLLCAGAASAEAAPIPFLAVSSGGQAEFHIAADTDLSFGSANQPNPFDPNDPVFGLSAPLVMQQLLPAPGGLEFGYLRMDAMSLVSVIPPGQPGDPVGFAYGPGSFSIALLDLNGPTLQPFLHADFSGVVVFLGPNLAGPTIFPASITFSGLSFGMSGLGNPGTGVLQLDPIFDGNGNFTGDLMLTSGTFSAEAPEPDSWLLLASGLPVLAHLRRRWSGRASHRTQAA